MSQITIDVDVKHIDVLDRFVIENGVKIFFDSLAIYTVKNENMCLGTKK